MAIGNSDCISWNISLSFGEILFVHRVQIISFELALKKRQLKQKLVQFFLCLYRSWNIWRSLWEGMEETLWHKFYTCIYFEIFTKIFYENCFKYSFCLFYRFNIFFCYVLLMYLNLLSSGLTLSMMKQYEVWFIQVMDIQKVSISVFWRHGENTSLWDVTILWLSFLIDSAKKAV